MIGLRIALLTAVAVLAPPITLVAQQEPPVERGDRVRVTVPSMSPEVLDGTLLELSERLCVLRVEDRFVPLTLPLDSVKKLELHRGQKSKAGLGAGLGFLTGAVVGGVLGSYWGQESCGWMEIPCIKKPEATALGAIGFGLAGAGIGALIGSRITVDRWEEVTLQRVRVGILLQRSSELTVSATLRL
jgi:hypothetical protein